MKNTSPPLWLRRKDSKDSSLWKSRRPRKQFILRPKKVKDYDSKSQYIKYESNKEETKEKDKKEEEEKPFEFKSIPKEIENKYIGDDKKEENKVYD